MILLGLFLVVASLGFVLVRRRRAARLAGLDSSRPVYSIEPPSRRLDVRRTERL